MKACRGSNGTAPLILNLGLCWREWSTAWTSHFTLPPPGVNWIGCWVGLDVLQRGTLLASADIRTTDRATTLEESTEYFCRMNCLLLKKIRNVGQWHLSVTSDVLQWQLSVTYEVLQWQLSVTWNSSVTVNSCIWSTSVTVNSNIWSTSVTVVSNIWST